MENNIGKKKKISTVKKYSCKIVLHFPHVYSFFCFCFLVTSVLLFFHSSLQWSGDFALSLHVKNDRRDTEAWQGQVTKWRFGICLLNSCLLLGFLNQV